MTLPRLYLKVYRPLRPSNRKGWCLVTPTVIAITARSRAINDNRSLNATTYEKLRWQWDPIPRSRRIVQDDGRHRHGSRAVSRGTPCAHRLRSRNPGLIGAGDLAEKGPPDFLARRSFFYQAVLIERGDACLRDCIVL